MDDLPNGYYMIGDNAFTLSNKMLIPFSGAQKNEEHKRTYNFNLLPLRIRIEIAFGRMTTKWRIFRRPLDTSLAKVRKIIAVAMMWHNYVIQEEGLVMNNLESDHAGNSVSTCCQHKMAPNTMDTYQQRILWSWTSGRMPIVATPS
jgi:DDE superfamily endonuclease